MQARSTGEPELLQAQRRRRESRDAERGSAPRRARRRRQSTTPWFQRNALGIAAVSILIAFLGLGFGLVQMLNHGDSAGSPLSLAQAELPAASNNTSMMSAAAVGGSVPVVAAPSTALDSPRSIRTSVKVLKPDYTIAQGDTLVKIAQRFNTTAERVQAFNNLSDPRSLRIGAQLIIPPPL